MYTKPVALITLLMPLLAESATGQGLNLRYNHDRSCATVESSVTFRSKHKLGDRNGALNERNEGFVVACHLNGSGLVLHIGGVRNSQWGDTFIVGMSYRAGFALTERLSFKFGPELSFIRYELPRRGNAYIYGFLPKVYAEVAYDIPRQYVFWNEAGDWTVFVALRHFPAGGRDQVILYSLGLRVSY